MDSTGIKLLLFGILVTLSATALTPELTTPLAFLGLLLGGVGLAMRDRPGRGQDSE